MLTHARAADALVVVDAQRGPGEGLHVAAMAVARERPRQAAAHAVDATSSTA